MRKIRKSVISFFAPSHEGGWSCVKSVCEYDDLFLREIVHAQLNFIYSRLCFISDLCCKFFLGES